MRARGNPTPPPWRARAVGGGRQTGGCGGVRSGQDRLGNAPLPKCAVGQTRQALSELPQAGLFWPTQPWCGVETWPHRRRPAPPRPAPLHPPSNVEQYPSAELTPGVLVVRLDAPVYFANCQWMRHKLEEYEEEAKGWAGGAPRAWEGACDEHRAPRLGGLRGSGERVRGLAATCGPAPVWSDDVAGRLCSCAPRPSRPLPTLPALSAPGLRPQMAGPRLSLWCWSCPPCPTWTPWARPSWRSCASTTGPAAYSWWAARPQGLLGAGRVALFVGVGCVCARRLLGATRRQGRVGGGARGLCDAPRCEAP